MLTVTAALGADVTELLSLPPGAFRPAPKVRSAVVRLTFRPAFGGEDRQRVIAVARAVFQQRRKMLSNALSASRTPTTKTLPRSSKRPGWIRGSGPRR